METNGLDAVSAHFPFERFMSDPEGIVAEAKALGLRYVGCAWIPHEGEFSDLTCRQAIMAFNRASALLSRQGLRFFYHIHGYEFQKHDTGTMLDLMMKDSNPATVHFEMDIFWVVHAGQDPVKLLEKYGSRWELLHLKDMKKSTETGLLTGHSDVTNDVALGAGKINLPPILAAAQKAGVKYYFLEDESPSSEQQIPASLKYLEKVAW